MVIRRPPNIGEDFDEWDVSDDAPDPVIAHMRAQAFINRRKTQMKTIKEIETDLVALAEAVVQHGKDFEAAATKHLVSTLSTFVIDVRRIADSLEAIAGHTKIISSPPAATSATAIPPDTTGTAPSIVGATTAEGTTVAS